MKNVKPSEIFNTLFSSMDSIGNQLKALEPDPERMEAAEAEMNDIKAKLQQQYPTYNALLEVAARYQLNSRFYAEHVAGMVKNFISGNADLFMREFGDSFQELKDLDMVEQSKALSLKMSQAIAGTVAKDISEMNAMHFNRLKSEARVASMLNGSDGGKKRADRYLPLRARAIELARSGKFESANHAASKIAPEILKMREAREVGFSAARAVQTIGTWLRKEGIAFSGEKK